MSEDGRCSLAVGGDLLKAGRSLELSGEVCVWTAGRALHVEIAQAELGGEGGVALAVSLSVGPGLWAGPCEGYSHALLP